jgi:5'-nucleotidase
MKKIVYIDMDGVLADFEGGVGRFPFERNPPEMYVQGFFRNLPVMPGAKQALEQLLNNEHIDVYIGSKPDSTNLWSATEKFQWIAEHFPALIKKIFLTCDKGHLNGHYLIDDDEEQWGSKFKGTFLHFDHLTPEESWQKIVDYFNTYKDNK